MFIKEKRDGTIKARGCADGRSQQENTDKVDTSSQTVSLEAMLLTCATDAKERQYAVHPDMRSHMGIIMTLGKGTTYSASTKQKLNTKSSTEAELVAIDDAMAQILWTRHFLAAQGEYVPTTTIYQDNKSTILLAENGKQSSSR